MRKNTRQPLKIPLRLGEIIPAALKSHQNDPKTSLSHLQYKWQEIAGPLLYRKSLPIKIFKKRLVVGVAGSSWANELEFMKIELLKKIQAALPDLPLDEIRFQISSRL